LEPGGDFPFHRYHDEGRHAGPNCHR
jgi:hypothetical protein